MREALDDGGVNGDPLGSDDMRQAAMRKWVLEAQEYYDLLEIRSASLVIDVLGLRLNGLFSII